MKKKTQHLADHDETKLTERLSNLPASTIKKPKLPIDVFIQEASDLHAWALDDRQLLLKAGLPAELLEDIPGRILLLADAQASWITAQKKGSGPKAKWKEAFGRAKALRKELLINLRYALRDQDVESQLRKLNPGGRSKASIIQHLFNLVRYANENVQPLTKVGFGAAKISEAQTLVSELPKLDGLAKSDQNLLEIRETRDRAYTYLLEAVTQVRRAGRFAHRNHPSRLKGYANRYFRRK